jgi:hypothetical protein
VRSRLPLTGPRSTNQIIAKVNDLNPTARVNQTVLAWDDPNSALWAEAGHTPAYEPILRTQAFRDLVPNRNYAEARGTCSTTRSRGSPVRARPSQNWLANSIQNALLGREDVGAAIDTFAKQINAALRKGSPL